MTFLEGKLYIWNICFEHSGRFFPSPNCFALLRPCPYQPHYFRL